MPPITRSFSASLLAPGLRRVYYETGKERPLEYPAILNVNDQEWNPETDLQISGLGTMPAKDEGDRFTLDEPIIGGTKVVESTPFGLACEITWEMWRDEQSGTMQEMVKGIARASRNRQEVSAASVLNNAFSTSFVGFTASESLCSTGHARLDGGTAIANRPSPDIGFSITGIQNSIVRFESLVDMRGMPRVMAPVLALVTPTNKFVAREILGSGHKPYTANNEINALIEEDLAWMVWHYSTSLTQWFLISSKENHDLQFRWRDHPIFDSYDDPTTKSAVFSGYQRHTPGFFVRYAF